MQELVDLTNLRSMTDGDVEMEKLLFEEFFSSFEDGITSLQNNIREDAAEIWRKQAHSLKGIALNLGAMGLGELCKKAQDEPNADVDSKGELLEDIKAEYELVKKFLRDLALAG